MQKLPEQVLQYRVFDVLSELCIKAVLVNGCIVAFDICAKDARCSVLAEVLMHALRALLAATVTFDMFA